MNILFTSSGRRNYLLSYFKKEIGDSGKIIAADMNLNAVSLAVADKAYKVSRVYSNNYIDEILDICTKENVDLVISLNDLELPVLTSNIKLFNKKNIEVFVSNKEVIDICFDKEKTNVFISELEIKSPKTFTSLVEAEKAIKNNNLFFPIVLKPRWGSGSIGIEIVENLNELELAYKLIDIKLNKTILNEISKSDRSNAILIQEKLNGQEYGIDIINDLNGNYQTTIVKKKISMRAGETDKAEIVDRKDIIELGKSIGNSLKHIGNLDCDVFDIDGELYVLELNPRFGGGYPFSHEAGVNLPKAILSWMKNEKVDIKDVLTPKIGKSFGKYDNLVELLSE